MNQTPRSTSIGARRTAQLLDDYGVVPRKRLGQNFIVDPNTIRMIVDKAQLSPRDRVLEIGAGAGALTVAIAGAVRQVTAVEIDKRLAPVLHDVVGGLDNVDVVIGDAKALDPTAWGSTRMMGNLPYSVATDLILHVLRAAPAIADLTVMVQKEVGDRLTACAGEKLYGRSCLEVRYFARTKVVGRVSRRAFLPVPNVDSVVVRLERRRGRPSVAGDQYLKIVKAAFSQRRKTMRNALTSMDLGSRDLDAALTSAGIDPEARPQEVGFEQFIELAEQLT